MALEEYADVQVGFEAQAVSRTGFGTLLFLTEDTTETAGTITGSFASIEEVESAGYTSGTDPYDFAQAAFAQGEGFSRLKIAHKDSTNDWPTAIGNVVSQDNDWYAIAIDSRTAADIEAVAGDIQARKKLFLAVSSEAAILDDQDSTDIASTLLSNNYSRTGVIYKTDADSAWPDAAWLGRMLPQDPGSVNWAWKSLSGQSADTFKSADVQAMEGKRCNYYTSVAGNNITYGGYTSEIGRFLDIIRGIDWLQVRMQEDYIGVQASQDRIPYVGGGEIIESEVVRRRLDMAVDEGVISDDYSVTVPNWRNQSETDRTARHYPGITFSATYVGAVNSIQVRGVVTP